MVFLSQFKHFMPSRNARLHVIIHGAAIEAGGIGLATAQIPGDRLVIGAVQISMVIQIGSEFGEELNIANMSTASSVTETIGWATAKYYEMKENK